MAVGVARALGLSGGACAPRRAAGALVAVVDDAFFAAVGAAGIFFLRTVDELILAMIQ